MSTSTLEIPARLRDGADGSAAERRHRGQHFTGRATADLMAALCVRAPGAVVLDPACGAGALLAAAATRLGHLDAGRGSRGRLIGVEIDAGLATAARRALPRATILQADFLAASVGEVPGEVDAILANPPYVRHELLDARARAAVARAPFPVSRRSDLHVAFWPRALERLAPGGRLCFLTSATWLDAAYGEALGRWICEGFRLIAVVEPQAESWFDRARVRTCLTIVERAEPDPEAPVRFVRLTTPLARIVPDSLAPSRRLARFDALARDIERGTLSPEAGACRERRLGLLREGRWGAALRQPDLHFEILDRAGSGMVPLGEVATVRWGIKTGDDAVFFIPRDADPPVEPRFLVPAVFSLMDLDRLEVSGETLRRLLLIASTGEEREGPRLRAWLRAAERDRGSDRRPTCAARARDGRAWWDLRIAPPGRILWSIMQQYRHLVPLNPGAFPVNDNLLQIDPVEDVSARLLAAILNSGVVALLKHAWGRQRNEGMLKTQARDVRAMPVPDPRRLGRARAAAILAAFDRIARRRIGSVTVECAEPDRRALDRLVIEACGWTRGADRMVDRLAAALTSLHARERRLERDAVSRRSVARAAAGDVRSRSLAARTP